MNCPGLSSDASYRQILVVALALNAAMAIIEIAASFYAGSVALQADALDFLGDAANYAVGLAVLGLAAHWRARAAMGKGMVMTVFGMWVAGNTAWHAISGNVPQSTLMGAIGGLALVVNLAVALLLFRHRHGDSNRLSVWLCTRNDAFANIAVILAAGAVSLTGSRWPDIAVAAAIAVLALTSAMRVMRQAETELRGTRGAAAQ